MGCRSNCVTYRHSKRGDFLAERYWRKASCVAANGVCSSVFSGKLSIMGMKTVMFRAPEETIAALDKIAQFEHRDRSFVINRAIDQYLSLNAYHRQLIEEGIRQADAGEVIPHENVVKRMADLIAKHEKR